ncbi:unnamed protein product [Psylliodes chrysocephalus]|uniref:Uncharacterized protein n=1 Tax=Psylliodes chrysocephalus TaxID=3402493 RepID=A0A9P0D9S5_9CUCU|nr:unnamed protein product [Psylliodes chrysocephala]
MYLVKCSQQIEHIVELVGKHRDKVEETVEAIMNEMKAIGIELDVEIRVPRLVTKQSFRVNPLVSTPEQYFKISILIPYLDSFCNSLKERFSRKQGPAIELQTLHPTKVRVLSVDILQSSGTAIADFYNITNLTRELELWHRF